MSDPVETFLQVATRDGRFPAVETFTLSQRSIMPKEPRKRYRLEIRYVAYELNDEGDVDLSAEPIFKNKMVHHGLDYVGLLGINQALVNFLQNLSNVGMLNGIRKGFGDKMRALGLMPPG